MWIQHMQFIYVFDGYNIQDSSYKPNIVIIVSIVCGLWLFF